jgi:hypothetical protein
MNNGRATGSPSQERAGQGTQVSPDAKKEGHGYEAARCGRSSARRGRGDRRLGRNLLQAFSGWWWRAIMLRHRGLHIVSLSGYDRRLTTLEALTP